MEKIIEFKNVNMFFGYKQINKVLRCVNFSISPGEWISITGPSGCGKTTFLNMAGCLLKPTTGRIKIEGVDTAVLDDNEVTGIRNKKIGFVFQGANFLPALSILDNVLVPTIFTQQQKLKRRSNVERAREILSQLGLGDRCNSLPHELSQGQKRRAAFARALINEPQIILADEPTNDLDSERAYQITEEMIRLHKQGMTLLTATHNPELASLADRQYRIAECTLCL